MDGNDKNVSNTNQAISGSHDDIMCKVSPHEASPLTQSPAIADIVKLHPQASHRLEVQNPDCRCHTCSHGNSKAKFLTTVKLDDGNCTGMIMRGGSSDHGDRMDLDIPSSGNNLPDRESDKRSSRTPIVMSSPDVPKALQLQSKSDRRSSRLTVRHWLSAFHGLDFRHTLRLEDAFPSGKTSVAWLEWQKARDPKWVGRDLEEWTEAIAHMFNYYFWTSSKLQILDELEIRALRQRWFREDAESAEFSALDKSVRRALPYAVLEFRTKVVQARVRYWQMRWKDTSYSPYDELCKFPRRSCHRWLTLNADMFLRFVGRDADPSHFVALFPMPLSPNSSQVSLVDIVDYVYWLADFESGTTALPWSARQALSRSRKLPRPGLSREGFQVGLSPYLPSQTTENVGPVWPEENLQPEMQQDDEETRRREGGRHWSLEPQVEPSGSG